MTTQKNNPQLETLAGLLRERLATIADHEFRDRDPEGHLDSLRTVSEKLTQAHQNLSGTLPPRLEHFMTGCSYQKALSFLEEMFKE